jgi:transposase
LERHGRHGVNRPLTDPLADGEASTVSGGGHGSGETDGIVRDPDRGGPGAGDGTLRRPARPHLEDGVPLARAADAAGVPLRTAQRWLARYRRDGLAGLARLGRSDAGARRSPDDLVTVIEGMGLKRPRLSAAAIHRRVPDVAAAQEWRARTLVIGAT